MMNSSLDLRGMSWKDILGNENTVVAFYENQIYKFRKDNFDNVQGEEGGP